MRDHFWATVSLSSRESTKYRKISREVSVLDLDEENSAVLSKALSSSKYTFDFKRKLVLHFPSLKQSRLWGCEMLAGEDLYELSKLLIVTPIVDLSKDEMEILYANPHFANSFGTPFDSLTYLFNHWGGGVSRSGLKMREDLVARLIEDGLMNIELAESVLNVRNGFYSARSADEMLESTANIIFDWAREAYDLGDEIPDSWVSQFLGMKRRTDE